MFYKSNKNICSGLFFIKYTKEMYPFLETMNVPTILKPKWSQLVLCSKEMKKVLLAGLDNNVLKMICGS